jgi:CRP-like cAMP-binding protein
MRTVDGRDLVEQFGMQYLQGASAFGALSATAIDFLMTNGRALYLDKGDVLYEPGDKGDKFYVVLQGSLAFYQLHDGEFVHICEHRFGAEVGFVAMIALHDRLGRSVAAQSSHVLEVSCGLFYDLHELHPSDFGVFLLNLSREMARTIRSFGDLIARYQLPHADLPLTPE